MRVGKERKRNLQSIKNMALQLQAEQRWPLVNGQVVEEGEEEEVLEMGREYQVVLFCFREKLFGFL